MPRMIPEPRYFSMPSSDVGSEVFKNLALYCWPWVRSLTHSPDAVIHSPAEIYLESSFMIDREEAEEILQEWIKRFVPTSTPSRHANASETYQGATPATEH